MKARVQIGLYKRSLVVIKRIFKRSIDLKRNILKELNAVRMRASKVAILIHHQCRGCHDVLDSTDNSRLLVPAAMSSRDVVIID